MVVPNGEDVKPVNWLLKFMSEFYIRVAEYVACGVPKSAAPDCDELPDRGVSGWRTLGTGWSACDIAPLDMNEVTYGVALVVDNDGSKSTALKV